MKNNKISLVTALKILFLIFIIGNFLYIACGLLLGDTSTIKSFATEIGICILFEAVLLILTELCGIIEQRIWKSKSNIELYGESDCKLLKCSGGYYQLPVVTALLDIMIGVSALRQYNTDAKELIEFLHNKDCIFGIAFIAFLNLCCVFVIFYYCHYKVYYNRQCIGIVSFFNKREISCAEIEEIIYNNKIKNEKLVLKTADGKVTFRLERLSDGWEEFLKYIINIAKIRHITINGKYYK